MGLLDGLFSPNKSKSVSSFEPINNQNVMISSIFGANSKVSEEEAMRIPAFSSSIELISSAIAQLPIYLYKEDANGEVTKVSDRRIFLLNNEPNETVTAYNFKKNLVREYLLYGASYTKIEKVRNEVIALYNLPIKNINISKYRKDGYKHTARISLDLNPNDEFYLDELILFLRDSEDGITSKGILERNDDVLRLAIDELEYSSNILRNGALPVGVLKASAKLTETAITRLRQGFERLYSGSKRAGKTLILEEGLDYQPISMKPNELDLTNSKKNTISELSRIVNLPESMINSSANKYASNEQNNIHFLQYCLSPIITSLENSLDKSLLLESEKLDGYYFRFDTSEVLRTTEKEKIDNAVRSMEKGLTSINEARSRLDLPALNKDFYTWSLGSIFYNPETEEMTIPNMGTVIDTNNLQKSIDEIGDSESLSPNNNIEKEMVEEWVLNYDSNPAP